MTDKDYIPYGEEWEVELMKLPKKFLINMYRKVCINYQELKDQYNELIESSNQEINALYDKAGMLEQRAIEAESEIRNIQKYE